MNNEQAKELIIKKVGRYDEDYIKLNHIEYAKLGGVKSFEEFVKMLALFFDYTFDAYILGILLKGDGTEWESRDETFKSYAKKVGKVEAQRVFYSVDNVDYYT